jgi:Ca2+-binding EF-hand superfamily protein
MKKTIIAGGLAALALAAGGVAVAQQQPGRAHRADADQDGRISRAEFVDGRTARLTALDTDRDGSVNAEERQAVRAQRAAARFDRVDADKDGAISRTEFDAARAERPEGRRGRHGAHFRRGGPRAERMAERRAERGPLAIAEVQAKTGQAFDRLDADHDGYLTAEERRAGFRAMREQHRARRAERLASPTAPASE